MHIHLDALGGISGNMFIGALLDLWPELARQLPEQLDLAGFGDLVTLEVNARNDGFLQGTYVSVSERLALAPAALGGARRVHAHRAWRDIRGMLQGSRLPAGIKAHALGIFGCLAEAEAAVHGTQVDEVEFHEVGAWDSIADIVCAAVLIQASGARSWSVSSLPLGRGLVNTAHGQLPVPAPAVTKLLAGFEFHDDGRDGERVTPTGAAILKYLDAARPRPIGGVTLHGSGHGFGSRKFAGIANVLRALVFEQAPVAAGPDHDLVSVLSFEVDDQTPEDLAVALDHIRKAPGVLDAVQYAVSGKKQRQCSSVRVIAAIEAESAVQHLCFTQTATLGIRIERAQRSVLPRWQETVELEGRAYRVKLARRPDGDITAKAELDDLASAHLDQAERQLVRELVEAIAIERHADMRRARDDAGDE